MFPLSLRSVVLVAAALFAGEGAFAAPSSSPSAKVESVSGHVWVERGGQRVRLRKGDTVRQSETVIVDEGAHARLWMGNQNVLDVGPESRLNLLEVARDDGSNVTNLRLEQGYLRMVRVSAEGKTVAPAAISFGKWATLASSGEFFFETGSNRSAVCGLAGDLSFAGAASDAPKKLGGGACVDLTANLPSITRTPALADWQVMREQRALGPTLGRIANAQAQRPAELSSPAAAPSSSASAASASKPLPPATDLAKADPPAARVEPAPAVNPPAAPAKVDASRPAIPPSRDPSDTISSNTIEVRAHLEVESVTGTASILREGVKTAAVPGMRFQQGEAIEVASDSGIRVSVSDAGSYDRSDLGTIELGPSSRATMRKMPTATAGSPAWLRLDQGTMLVTWSPPDAAHPVEVAFSQWAAKAQAGEFFFEGRSNDRATACQLSGAMSFAGVPSTLPQGLTKPCAELRMSQAATPMSIPEVESLRETIGIARILRAKLPAAYYGNKTGSTVSTRP